MTATCARGPLDGMGVVFGGHRHDWPALLELTRAAETLGAGVVVIDGDTSYRPSRPQAPILHSWSATTALLALTERVAIGSMRIVSHWNTAHLASALATTSALAPGRLRFMISIGGQIADRRVGLAAPRSARERTQWLDEMLDALEALWAGGRVDRRGRFVQLEAAQMAPGGTPLPVEIGGRGPGLLDLIARRARCWDINLPPVPRLVDAADAALARSCERIGRDPSEIGRSMWIALRVDAPVDDALRREYRAINPWFPMLRDEEVDTALVAGSPAACRERIEEIREMLRIDLPLLDLSGLDRDGCLRSLERMS